MTAFNSAIRQQLTRLWADYIDAIQANRHGQAQCIQQTIRQLEAYELRQLAR